MKLLPLRFLSHLQHWALCLGNVGIWLGILPFFLLCRYAHPSADDFLQATDVSKYGHWGYLKYMYLSWSGRYTAAVGWSFLNPVSYGRLGAEYKLVCLLLLALMLATLVLMLATLLQGAGCKSRQLWQAGAGAFLLLVYQLPSTAEGFYWLTASFTYLLAGILLFLAVAALTAGASAGPGTRPYYTATAAFLLFLTVGCNETTALPILLTTGAAAVVYWKKQRLIGLTLVLVVSLGCALAFLAPGNAMRVPNQQLGSLSLLASASNTFIFTGYCLINWLGNGVLAAVTLLLVPALARLARRPGLPLSRLAKHPMLLALLVPAFLAAGLFPSFWVRGVPPPLRALNLLYMCFVASWMLATYAWVLYAVERRTPAAALRLPTYVRWALLAWLPCTFLTDYNHHLRSAGYRLSTNNSSLAYRDLLHGKAARYDAELTARYHYLHTSPIPGPQVPVLTDPPITLLYGDIGTDTANWGNRAYAEFFHKRIITAQPPASGR